MSKRTAFSRKSEQRHWRLRHDQEEAARQQKRAQKLERRAGNRQEPDVHAARSDTYDADGSAHEPGSPPGL